MRIAIYENLPPGGAKRASFEFGRFLAGRHEVDLYQLSITDNRAFDLTPSVRQVYRYRFAPLGGLLDARLAGGHYAPRSYMLFGPLRRLHRRIAHDLRGRGYDVVLAHTDAMTQSPYLLRWLGDVPSVYYCQEVFRVRYEPLVRALHRQRLRQSRFPVSALRLIEDAWVLRWPPPMRRALRPPGPSPSTRNTRESASSPPMAGMPSSATSGSIPSAFNRIRRWPGAARCCRLDHRLN